MIFAPALGYPRLIHVTHSLACCCPTAEALKAARKVENSVLVGQKSGALTAKLTKQLAQALNKYHEKMAMAPVSDSSQAFEAWVRKL